MEKLGLRHLANVGVNAGIDTCVRGCDSSLESNATLRRRRKFWWGEDDKVAKLSVI